MNREMLAWAAGLFEGEGCSTIHKNQGGKYLAPRLYVVTTDLDVLQRFQLVLGMGRILIRKKDAKYKQQYEWSVGTYEEVQAVLAMFWPWLGFRRRERAREVLLTMRNYYMTVNRYQTRPVFTSNFAAWQGSRAEES